MTTQTEQAQHRVGLTNVVTVYDTYIAAEDAVMREYGFSVKNACQRALATLRGNHV